MGVKGRAPASAGGFWSHKAHHRTSFSRFRPELAWHYTPNSLARFARPKTRLNVAQPSSTFTSSSTTELVQFLIGSQRVRTGRVSAEHSGTWRV